MAMSTALIPDYIEDLLRVLNPYVHIELLRLLSGETTTSCLIQKRYRSKLNRQKYVNLGIVLQLYKDIQFLEV